MVFKRFVLSSETDFDLEEVFEYSYHKFGPNQATKYLSEIDEVFNKLLDNPEIGRTRSEIKKGLYSIPFGSHIIFYSIQPDYIRIVRVLHGIKDLPRNF